MTARFIQPEYPQGRILLVSGKAQIGAIFPPAVATGGWRWRMWMTPYDREGVCKTEQAAKNALMGAWRDFLRAADLVEVA